MELYTYFRSSAAYRVRIAFNLKRVAYLPHPIHLLRSGGENWKPAYLALNPQGLLPTLVDGGQVLTQSLAILEYLEERYPRPPLLPNTLEGRARVRALAQIIACDIHPLNNLRVLEYLRERLGAEKQDRDAWYRHWIAEGFRGLEEALARDPHTGLYCHADRPGLADCCLVPQVYNARRFRCGLRGYPTIARIYAACMDLPAFRDATPENQPDAEDTLPGRAGPNVSAGTAPKVPGGRR